jgi:hypothetical protein
VQFRACQKDESKKKMKPGVYQQTMQEYQADKLAPEPSLSSHIANILLTQSPRHAWFAHPRLNPNYKSEESTDFDLGACAHAVLLEGEGAVAAVEAKDWRTKEAQQTREALREQGKIPVLAHKLVAIRSMADAARAALAACELGPIDLTSGKAEEVHIWQEDGVWCRARLDWRRPGLTLDYKSTAGSASPSAWIRNQMVPMGFDVQAVHYGRATHDKQFVFLVQENYPPYECSFVGLSPAMIDVAQRKWDLALALWKRCLQTGKWPGYPLHIAYAEPTAWQIDEDEERRLTFDEIIELAGNA